MKIKFESTIEDSVEAEMRVLLRSRTVLRWKRTGLIGAPILFVAFYLGTPDTVTVKLVFATLVGAMYIYLSWFRYEAKLRKRLAKLAIERRGTDQPISCEVEVGREGLTCKQSGIETKISWDRVCEVLNSENEIEILLKNAGIVLIPNRVFCESHQRDEWLAFCKEAILGPI